MSRIATIAELRPYLGFTAEEGLDEGFLQSLLDGAEVFLEGHLNRTFAPLPDLVNGADTAPPVVKTFGVHGKARVRVPDLRSPTAVTLDGVSLIAETDYSHDGFDEPAVWLTLPSTLVRPPVPPGRGLLSVTGRWGFPDPEKLAGIKDAILTLAARKYKRRDANWSDTNQTASGAVFFYSRDIPDEIKTVLDDWRIQRFVFA
jgi:hypothetical protein